MRLYTVLLYILQIALHVSDDTLIHHQEHIQTVITTSSTGRTVFATVITVWMCSWWGMRVSSATCRAVCRKYNKTVYSRILLDNYWHWFTMHGPMNIKD